VQRRCDGEHKRHRYAQSKVERRRREGPPAGAGAIPSMSGIGRIWTHANIIGSESLMDYYLPV